MKFGTLVCLLLFVAGAVMTGWDIGVNISLVKEYACNQYINKQLNLSLINENTRKYMRTLLVLTRWMVFESKFLVKIFKI
jgi:hypothetical protein